MIRIRLIFAMVLSLVCYRAASAGWAELGDAPDGVPGRQDTVGAGALDSISGTLDSDGGDFVDTFSIVITDVDAFYATTSPNVGSGGDAEFDTRLWLWTDAGVVQLGNDDTDTIGGDFGSTLFSPDATPPHPVAGGVDPSADGIDLVAGRKYLLTISGFSNDPEDAAGAELVRFPNDFDALHGPWSVASGFDAWENADVFNFSGAYDIAIGGATYCRVPEPTAWTIGAFVAMGVAVWGRNGRLGARYT